MFCEIKHFDNVLCVSTNEKIVFLCKDKCKRHGKSGMANSSWSQLSHITFNSSEVSISNYHVTELHVYIIIDFHF